MYIYVLIFLLERTNMPACITKRRKKKVTTAAFKMEVEDNKAANGSKNRKEENKKLFGPK